VIPPSGNNSRLRNEWGGAINVRVFGATSQLRDNALSLELTNVPQRVCVRLSTADAAGNGVFANGIRMIGFRYRPPSGPVIGQLNWTDPNGPNGGYEHSPGNLVSSANLCQAQGASTMDLWNLISLNY